MAGEGWKAAVAATLLAIVFLTVLRVDAWNAEPVQQETLHGIAEALFDTYLVAFLILAVLLTGALLGALYLGMPSSADEEEGEA